MEREFYILYIITIAILVYLSIELRGNYILFIIIVTPYSTIEN